MSKKQPSRQQRWYAACSKMREAFDKVEAAVSEYNDAKEELKEVWQEYEEWRENLPENLQQSALGEKLEELSQLDLDTDLEIDSATVLIDDAEGVDLPLGFGRD